MSVARHLLRDSALATIIHFAPRASNALLFIIIARSTNQEIAGVFALAMTYLIILAAISQGIDDLIIRQVARQPDQSAQFLSNFLAFRTAVSLALFLIAYGLVWVFGYPASSRLVILIMVLSLIPSGIANTCQAVLFGTKRFALPTLIQTLDAVAKLVAGSLAIQSHNLVTVALYWLLISSISAIVFISLTSLSLKPFPRPNWADWSALKLNWRDSWAFLGVTLLAALEGQVDILILSIVQTEAVIGWYNAATTITFTWTILSQAFRMSIYPVMIRYAASASDKLASIYQASLRLMGLLVFPLVAGVWVLAEPIVLWLYKPAFAPSILIVRILLPMLVFVFLNVPSARLMFVHNRQDKMTQFLAISFATNLVLNLALDKTYGANGAALARLCSTAVLFALIYAYAHMNLQPIQPIRLFSKPLLAALIMGLIVWVIRDQTLWLVIPAGVLIYALLLIVTGGIRREDLNMLGLIFKKGRITV